MTVIDVCGTNDSFHCVFAESCIILGYFSLATRTAEDTVLMFSFEAIDKH